MCEKQFIIKENKDIITIYDKERHTICWYKKDTERIQFLYYPTVKELEKIIILIKNELSIDYPRPDEDGAL